MIVNYKSIKSKFLAFFGKAVALLTLLCMLLNKTNAESELPNPTLCNISGSDPVSQYSTVTYTLTCGTATNWTISCGTITSTSGNTATIYFNHSTCTSATISVVNSANGSTLTRVLTINAALPLSPGSITSNGTQSIAFEGPVAQIGASAASGGTCGSYIYQWWYSSDNNNFQQVAGAVSQNYTPGILAVTTYYKRQVTCDAATGYTSTATITVAVPTSGVPPASNISGSGDPTMNWSIASGYDASGHLLSQTKAYYDNNGSLLQNQQKVFYRRDANAVFTHVFANQSMKDAYGNDVMSTLQAPIDNAEFQYKGNFVKAADGSNYTYKNFDRFNPSGTETDKTNLPEPVGGQSTKGTLGWYYGVSNDWEPYVPTSNYPYARKALYRDGSGSVKMQGGAGEILRMGAGHEASALIAPVNHELNDYLLTRSILFQAANIGTQPAVLTGKAIQEISQGGDGNESILIRDINGKLLMSAKPGGDLVVSNSIGLAAANDLNYSVKISAAPSASFQILSLTGTGAIVAYSVNPMTSSISQLYAGDVTGWTTYSGTNFNGTVIIQSEYQLSAIYSPSGGGGGKTLISQVNGAPVPNIYYFNIFSDNTSIAISGGGSYTLIKMKDETVTTLLSGNKLDEGYYKIIVNTGIVNLGYSMGFSDITYNYYNHLGQLVANIAPNGVKLLILNGASSYGSISAVPFAKTFAFDVQGRLTSMTDPDRGTNSFVYRSDGKLRFFQNGVQSSSGTGKYKYYNYDQIGRLVESGEYQPDASGVPFGSPSMTSIIDNVSQTGGITTGVKSDVTITAFDIPDNGHGLTGYIQDQANLGSAISNVSKYSSITNNSPSAANLIARTWYSYDEEGRIVWQIKMLQNLAGGNLYKTTDLAYDLMGRLIKKVFQKNTSSETFVHYYKYDEANQQLWKVYTNTTDVAITEPLSSTYQLQATYIYYLHGGLKRVEIADQLQGVDYTYTLDGKLKAVNNNKRANDPGGDGTTNAFPQDAFGMILDYFSGDYNNARSIGIKAINGLAAGNDNYSGNIRSMSWYSEKPSGITGLNDNPVGYIYSYDNKNQYTDGVWAENLNMSNAQGTATTYNTTGINNEKIVNPGGGNGYDPNGNILYLQRTNTSGVIQEKFAYNYSSNNNRLLSVVNSASGSPVTYANYSYDASGQLVTETNADPNKTKYIQYDSYGKVTLVAKDATFSNTVSKYVYDEMGNRAQKVLYNPTTGAIIQVVYYFDDVIFTQTVSGGIFQAVIPSEYTIEGMGGRLGVFYKQGTPVYAYEMTDHLGNVRAVIAKNGTTAEVRMYTDYYPYGMPIVSGGTNDYRYGFQGKNSENDAETDWNSFELRMYDSRIARWLQYDPETQFHSPYIAMGNNPINGIDANGGSFIDRAHAFMFAALHGGRTGYSKSKVDGKEYYTVSYSRGESNVDVYLKRWQNFSSNFIADATVKGTFGLQAGVKGYFWGLDGKVEGGAWVADIGEAKWDIRKMKGDGKWDTEHRMHNFIGAEGQMFSDKTATSLKVDYTYKYDTRYDGLPTMIPGTGDIDPQFSIVGFKFGKKLALIEKVFETQAKQTYVGGDSKDKSFWGVDVGGSLKLILGVDVKLRIGWEFKTSLFQ